MKPYTASLPYLPDTDALFPLVGGLPWPVLLDSGRPHGALGRYDILAASPRVTLVTRGGRTEIRRPDGIETSGEDPFALLRRELGPPQATAQPPFAGGAIGYFGYDLARRLERLPDLSEDAEAVPEMAVGLYDWAVVVDHERRESRLVARRDRVTVGEWRDLQSRFGRVPAAERPVPFRLTGPIRSNLSREAYFAAFDRVQRYLREGDCYQVNLAQRFCAAAEGDPWEAYRRLRRATAAPFSAYLSTPDVTVMSASPERFLALHEGRVETRPIKGTRRRDSDPVRDRALACELAASTKDRAENLMIVDLLRNDLGKGCRPGSIRVPDMFAVESFATVHHLVSTVTGELAPGQDACSLLRGCFPGGSITGAPKLRAMEIIEALEPHRRGVYCGAIGYIGYDGAMDTNIAIRTLVYSGGTVRLWAGGGIVVDSEAEAEYQESLDKAAALLAVLQGNGAD